jgi:hypothetical protein
MIMEPPKTFPIDLPQIAAEDGTSASGQKQTCAVH